MMPRAVPVGGGPWTEPAPDGSGVEPAAHRLRSAMNITTNAQGVVLGENAFWRGRVHIRCSWRVTLKRFRSCRNEYVALLHIYALA